MAKIIVSEKLASMSAASAADKLKEGTTVKYIVRSYKAGGAPDKKGTVTTKIGRVAKVETTKDGKVKSIHLDIPGFKMNPMTPAAAEKLLKAPLPKAGDKTAALRVTKGDAKEQSNKQELAALQKERNELVKQVAAIESKIRKLSKKESTKTTAKPVAPKKGMIGWLTRKMQIGTDKAKPSNVKTFVKVVAASSKGTTFQPLNTKTGQPIKSAKLIQVHIDNMSKIKFVEDRSLFK